MSFNCLISKIYNEIQQLNSNEANNLIENEHQTTIEISQGTGEMTQWLKTFVAQYEDQF